MVSLLFSRKNTRNGIHLHVEFLRFYFFITIFTGWNNVVPKYRRLKRKPKFIMCPLWDCYESAVCKPWVCTGSALRQPKQTPSEPQADNESRLRLESAYCYVVSRLYCRKLVETMTFDTEGSFKWLIKKINFLCIEKSFVRER